MGTYKNWTEHHHVECVHEQILANQGLRLCFVGDITDCEHCPYKKPEDYDVQCACASTGEDDEILYINAQTGEQKVIKKS